MYKSIKLLILLIVAMCFSGFTSEPINDQSRVSSFINRFAHVAVDEMHKYGIPASVKLAQAALESGWGRHTSGNNYFGIKASRWDGDHHPRLEGRFRSYETAWLSFRDHSRFLVNNYSWLRNNGLNWQAWCDDLGTFYAEDPLYPQKLKRIIRSNKLYEFDSE